MLTRKQLILLQLQRKGIESEKTSSPGKSGSEIDLAENIWMKYS